MYEKLHFISRNWRKEKCTAIFVVLCTCIGANAYCHLIGRGDENILSSCIDQSDDTIHLLLKLAHKATKMAVHPSHE